MACLSGARGGICVGSADYCRRGSVSNFFHALQQKPNDRPRGCPLQFEDKHGSIHHEPKRDDPRLRSRQPYRRLHDGRCDHIDVVGYWNERRDTFGNRQRALKSAAVPRTDLFACASSCSGHPAVQYTAPFIVITLTILLLHVASANLLTPTFIATRVSIVPVAATVGILFWGWLWGVMGLLLAVPLTAFVKLVADLHPSLCHVSNMLALAPRATPRWVRYGEMALERASPYLRGRQGVKPGANVPTSERVSST